MRNVAFAILSLIIASQSLNAAPKKKGKAKEKAAPAAAEAPAAAPAAAEPDAEAGGTAAAPAAMHEAAGSYGMAGCGLGSLVIKGRGKFSQVFAATLNGTGVQTFGLTSGTSNCTPGKNEMASIQEEVFVATFLSSLNKEAAQGKGTYLDGLADILGCQGDEQRLRFGQLSQENYADIFAKQNAADVLVQYKALIQADSQIQCHQKQDA